MAATGPTSAREAPHTITKRRVFNMDSLLRLRQTIERPRFAWWRPRTPRRSHRGRSYLLEEAHRKGVDRYRSDDSTNGRRTSTTVRPRELSDERRKRRHVSVNPSEADQLLVSRSCEERILRAQSTKLTVLEVRGIRATHRRGGDIQCRINTSAISPTNRTRIAVSHAWSGPSVAIIQRAVKRRSAAAPWQRERRSRRPASRRRSA